MLQDLEHTKTPGFKTGEAHIELKFVKMRAFTLV